MDEPRDLMATLDAWLHNGDWPTSLPASPEKFLALAYERWLGAAGTGRRSFRQFQQLALKLKPDLRPTSLFRKLKGVITPTDRDLKGCLLVLFHCWDQKGIEDWQMRRDGDVDLSQGDPLKTNLADKVADFLTMEFNRLRSGFEQTWMLSGRQVILGHDPAERDWRFWQIYSHRMRKLCERRSEWKGIPLNIFIIGGNLTGDSRDGFQVRAALSQLQEAVSGMLFHRAAPPAAPPDLQYGGMDEEEDDPDIVSSDYAGSREFDSGILDLFRLQSVVCLVDTSRANSRFAGSRLKTGIDLDKLLLEHDWLKDAIDPAFLMVPRDAVCVHTRIDLEGKCGAKNIVVDHARMKVRKDDGDRTAAANQGVRLPTDLLNQVNFAHFAYWQVPYGNSASTSENGVDDFPEPLKPPARFRSTLIWILLAASARLHPAPAADSFAQAALKLMENLGVRILTIDELLTVQYDLLLKEDRTAPRREAGSQIR